ncbi:ABC transporter ATP-binding protein [Shewanella avicenniae]|uniref:ABC transporter ATP-binding protein n=1 Tax=Shewanella avicenniae TaxID=2814294 RepID=A0ABX7QQR2_9GAMM|nr:ABC transporter ATP-binding protein [Shewanella avicenniae]QSX33809.1 ABC transporter ATP-binding protein [Shewanella avicenniae]
MRLLELDGVNFNYGSGQPWIFRDLNFRLESGSCHCLTGPTGSGKSTLLQLLAGLLSRPFEGGVFRRQGLLVGLVMQDPQVQLLRQTVGAEVAFALENLALASEEMIPMVQRALRRVGLFVSLDCPISNLSLGQKYRLMMAAQLVCNPAVLLLDEPWAQLDDRGVDELLMVIRGLVADGIAVVISEHNPRPFDGLVDNFWQLADGRLLAGIYQTRHTIPMKAIAARDEVIVEFDPFEYRFLGDSPLFSSEHPLQVRRGELISIVGDNGAGKSSLMKSMAGIQGNTASLPLKVFGERPKAGAYGAKLGLLMQRPNRQLFENSVHDEITFSLKRFSLPLDSACELLHELGLAEFAKLSPHKLSYGQQHLVALASLVCYQPQLLLLDDPLAGLDAEYFDRFCLMINRLREQGSAVVITSHRPLKHIPTTQQWDISKGMLLNRHSVEETHHAC